jgi:enoyl-CoA hydratase/carnithine racemase
MIAEIQMTDLVLCELDQGVLTVRINRVEKKNALTTEMYEVMADAVERAGNDGAIRVLLFTGSGGVFTAGNDLVDFLQNPPSGPRSPVYRFIDGLLTTDVPVVAAVDGFAVGIGTTMLLHCEQVFATARAKFSLPFINLGILPEAGSSMLLAENCGYQKAAELLMLGEPFNGEEALRVGIVSHLSEPEELMEDALATARKLAAKPRDALRTTKRLMRRPKEPLDVRVQRENELFAKFLASPEAREAMAAFLEKRKPDFEQFQD